MQKLKTVTYNDLPSNIKIGTTNDGWHNRKSLIIQENKEITITSLDIISDDGLNMRHFARLTIKSMGDTFGIEIELPEKNEIDMNCKDGGLYVSLCHYQAGLNITIVSPNILKLESE